MKNWVFGRHKDDSPAWPVDENGVPAAPAVAAVMPDSQMMAESAAAMLHACGIPARLELPGDGTLGRIVLGASGFGVALVVPEDRLEEAKALLETDASAEAEDAAE